jgi:hypothetical protein
MIASKMITRKWTVPASGTALLTEIVNNDDYIWFNYVDMRAGRTNSGDITWSDENGAPGGYLEAGGAKVLGDSFGARLVEVTFWGTAGDVVYMTIGISLGYPAVG